MEMVPFALLTRHREILTGWCWPKKVRFFPRTEFMWTVDRRRKVGFRAWISEIIGERTEESSGIKKAQQIVDRLNQVTHERVKVKAEKCISFQGQINSLPTCVSPFPSLQAAEKDSAFWLARNQQVTCC